MTPVVWSSNEDENEAIADLQTVVLAMARSLQGIDEARYLDPAGGFVLVERDTTGESRTGDLAAAPETAERQ